MEFDSTLALVQAVLKNQKKLHGDLLNISEGNETEITAIKSKLLEVVVEESMTKDDLRRVYLLLLLNTDLDCFEDLHNDQNYVHLLDSNPEISKLLFIKIVNHLKLEEFLYESVIFLPPVLSAEVVEIYLTLLKIRDPFCKLKHVDLIARACFCKLILLNDSGENNIFNVKLKYFDYLQLIMETFNSSKIDDYKSWEQNKLYYFSACIMKAMTSIVKKCCSYFIQPIIKKESYHNIYNIDIKKEFDKKVKLETEIMENDLIKTCLQGILSKFFCTAQSVTILTWMSWLELEEYSEENLQLAIGNEVFYCLSLIKDEKIRNCINSSLHSELITVLTSLSIKPTDEDDHIKSADIQTILSSINDPIKNQAKWLCSLISHEDFIPDWATLNTINEKVNLLDQITCRLLLDKFVKSSLVVSDCEDETNIKKNNLFKQIVLTSLKNFHIDNQIVILESFITEYGLIDLLKLPDFESQITEIFNKVIDKEDNRSMDFYSDFIHVTFQSPVAVVKKILKESLSSTQHGKLMVNLLKVIKPVCFYKQNDTGGGSTLYSIIIEMMISIDLLSDTEMENFVILITRLINKSLINGNEFLNGCLMPYLHESIKLQKWCLVILLLELLKSYTNGSVKVEDCDLKSPVHLVFLGQLMDKTRCTLSNYNAQCNAVYDKALEVFTCALEFFDEEEELIGAMHWMRNEVQKLNVITQLHVVSHLNSSLFNEAISKTNIEVYWLKLILCGIDSDVSFLFDMRRDLFVRTLSKLLPGFAIREWEIMFTGLVPKEEIQSLHELFLAASDAVLLLEAAIIPHIDEFNADGEANNVEKAVLNELPQDVSSSATACLSFIIRNLITIFQDIISPHLKKMSKEHISEIFFKICKILHEFPQAASSTSWIILKVLQDLISFAELPKVHKQGESYVEINKFCAGIGLLKNIDLRQNLSKALMSSVKCNETVV